MEIKFNVTSGSLLYLTVASIMFSLFYFLLGMDANELKMGIVVDCKKSRLVHTSDSVNYNGHTSTLNLSYQVCIFVAFGSLFIIK